MKRSSLAVGCIRSHLWILSGSLNQIDEAPTILWSFLKYSVTPSISKQTQGTGATIKRISLL